MLSQVDYEMHYIKGEDNIAADRLSRFPMLGPRRPTQEGLNESLNILLSALLKTPLNTERIWFYVQKDTKFLVPQLYDWCQARKQLSELEHVELTNCYHDALTPSSITKKRYTFGIWAPAADKVTRCIREALRRGNPFACLVPTDLIHQIHINHQGEPLPGVKRLVEQAGKIVFTASGLVWLIHGITIRGHCQQVYMSNKVTLNGERVTPEFELAQLTKHLADSNLTPIAPVPNTATVDTGTEEGQI